MSTTYCTRAQARAYASEYGITDLPGDDNALDALIRRSEQDVDLLVGNSTPRDPLTGRRLAPGTLTADAQIALARGTAASAIWRAVVGERELLDPDGATSVSAGGVSISLGPTVRPPCPLAVEEMVGYGILRKSGTLP